jgi:hypothetical protein
MEPGKCLTVSAEPQCKDPKWAKYLPWIVGLFTANYWLRVDIEAPLVWDNSVERPLTTESVVIERIEDALTKIRSKYIICRIPARH